MCNSLIIIFESNTRAIMKIILNLFCIFFSTMLYGQINLNQGLVAYYPFSGNSNDMSGNGNNPSFNNATLTADQFGNANSAYYFDGATNYIQIPNSSTLQTSQITLSAWVKPSGFNNAICHGNRILSKGIQSPGNTDNAYFLGFEDWSYTNHQNCNGTPPDTLHETFSAEGFNLATPFIVKDKWIHYFLKTVVNNPFQHPGTYLHFIDSILGTRLFLSAQKLKHAMVKRG